MKKCFKCGALKPLDEYYKHKQMADGHLNKCKDCTKKDSNANEKCFSKSAESYDKSEKGVIRVIYKTQKSNSRQRGMKAPNYTKKELSEWMYQNGFKALYEKWKQNRFQKNDKPSVDRIDNFISYTLDNLILGTWSQNFNNAILEKIEGRGKCGLVCKPVLQYDKNGKMLAEYVSFSSAKRLNGYSMESAIRTGRADSKGYFWKYK